MILRQALRFAGVGVIGFVVDAGVLTLAMLVPGVNRYSGRCVSFLVAVTATWAMNRTFTFKQGASDSLWQEWLRFFAANSVGGLVNLSTYAWLSANVAIAHEFPVAAVAAGSLSGLCVNFTLSKIFVFREATTRYG